MLGIAAIWLPWVRVLVTDVSLIQTADAADSVGGGGGGGGGPRVLIALIGGVVAIACGLIQLTGSRIRHLVWVVGPLSAIAIAVAPAWLMSQGSDLPVDAGEPLGIGFYTACGAAVLALVGALRSFGAAATNRSR